MDAVYVSSPNALHVSQAKALVAAGKHVLVEKSLGSNEREAAELFRAADETGVVAMEAMRNLHSPGFAAIESARWRAWGRSVWRRCPSPR